ncbi:PASTA domain-containing protein [Cryptosporangium sp. NPDC051539]|uniref:PASTA domain-containing protein n=1 Tax=Cryptosporangium sp. NPDC051539 TaxID=3363962 RepID=UPI0037A2EC7E
MRPLKRAVGLAAALLLASVAFSAAPASAQGVNEAVPRTLPSATLTSASVTFNTNDEDKDGDTLVRIRIWNKAGALVSLTENTYTHFDDNSVHGPYALNVPAGVPMSDLQPGQFEIFIVPSGGSIFTVPNDTWRFNYKAILNFSDGTSYKVSQNGIELTEWNRFVLTPFTPVTQVSVPDVTGQSQAGATSALQAAGLVVGTITKKVDPTCDNINTVTNMSPDAGTIVDPGTVVNLTIGTKPKVCS